MNKTQPPRPPRCHRAARLGKTSPWLPGGLLLLWLGSTAWATPVPWAEGCQPYMPEAEAYHHLPSGLLQAVALAESGREGEPYPWSLNIAGQPVRAKDYAEAALLLRDPAGQPRRDVAIGCMQIHMFYHLDSFIDPEWALHPRYNVWYAALFLARLRQQHGNWPAAIRHYHASDPRAGADYLCRVSGYLVKGAPATANALGLASCRAPTDLAVTSQPPRLSLPSSRALVMARRQVGRIIVLGKRE